MRPCPARRVGEDDAMDAEPADGEPVAGDRTAPAREDDGAVCWLERVCDACGGLGDGPPAPVCGRCGTPRP